MYTSEVPNSHPRGCPTIHLSKSLTTRPNHNQWPIKYLPPLSSPNLRVNSPVGGGRWYRLLSPCQRGADRILIPPTAHNIVMAYDDKNPQASSARGIFPSTFDGVANCNERQEPKKPPQFNHRGQTLAGRKATNNAWDYYASR